jgi:hypothetical protein
MPSRTRRASLEREGVKRHVGQEARIREETILWWDGRKSENWGFLVQPNAVSNQDHVCGCCQKLVYVDGFRAKYDKMINRSRERTKFSCPACQNTITLGTAMILVCRHCLTFASRHGEGTVEG